MKILVIEVKRGEEVGYLAGTSCLDLNSVVDNPLEAINYLVEPKQRDKYVAKYVGKDYSPDTSAQHALQGLHLTGDAWYGRSSVHADSACIVELEVEFKETKRSEPRPPNGQ